MTKLQTAVGSRRVVALVDGKYSLTPNSNLYRAIVSAGYSVHDVGRTISVVCGARRRRLSEGYKMAIVDILGV